jgi:hypothetical protein
MNRTMIATLVAALGLSMASPALGQEAPRKQPAAKPTYFVSGGSCSRSWTVFSKHDTFVGALEAANKMRKAKSVGRVVISIGSEPGLPPDVFARTCQVYSLACRLSWQVHVTTNDIAAAKKLAEELTRSGRDVEIVYEMAQRS